ncbi:hypothetical protein J4401_02260 [Candidatus Woesearchaeota archaeon]|nr:hypothetical protein [Candidatus Woesearchaeota archaeon]
MHLRILIVFALSLFLLGCNGENHTINDGYAEDNNVYQINTGEDYINSVPEQQTQPYRQEENFPEQRRGWEILTEKERKMLSECNDVLFSFSPVPIDSITNIEPIGEANPPEHTLASISSDTYIAVEETTTLVAPGDIWIILIQPRYGVTQDPEDHVIKYAMCKDIYGVVDHVKGFSPEMQQIVDNFECPDQNTEPGDDRCPILSMVPVKAGTPLGKVGGMQGNFNFGTWDLRVNHAYISPKRHGQLSLHSTCPFDYYGSPLKEQLMGKIKRQDEGRCGTVLHDIPGTLQGDWFIGDATIMRPSDWGKLLFLGHDNDFPEQLLIVASGIFVERPTKWFITPEKSGMKNRDFGEVKDYEIYCYDNEGDEEYRNYEKGKTEGRILIQLSSKNELKIEHQNDLCKAGNWQFKSPVTYIR